MREILALPKSESGSAMYAIALLTQKNLVHRKPLHLLFEGPMRSEFITANYESLDWSGQPTKY